MFQASSIQERAQQFYNSLMTQLGKGVIGYNVIKKLIFLCLLVDGNVMLVGLPGLAKTTLVNALMRAIKGLRTSRIQCTADTKPDEITGAMVWDFEKHIFKTLWGPAVVTDKGEPTNLVLADEANRCPPNTTSSLLQLGQEKSCTIGGFTRDMEEVYMIMATRNPIEQEGTYPMSEALTDRFYVELFMDYESFDNELAMLSAILENEGDTLARIEPAFSIEDLLELRTHLYANAKKMSLQLRNYIVRFVRGTRSQDPTFAKLHGAQAEEFQRAVLYGASPRAMINIAYLAMANALIEGKALPDESDVQTVASHVLRHRIIINPAAGRKSLTVPEQLTRSLIENVAAHDGNLPAE